ncbi:hypothetical protein [Frigidibacter mobilis]|uniref:Tetratricopeptide repeat protein n=1 Tax=Frigidibacter mobilis TaxID=1335048 RepID=A0A159Z8H9_9RHOB|nr:hypothetical protein [Frigidibacter mobilis]AMY71817.1 hypothetical protein AKL17_4607 [Frigidibacter mobilis]
MSNVKDIAEQGTAFCAAALPFIVTSPAASGLAAVAAPVAVLTAIGYTIWKSCGRRACDRASGAALAQLRANPDFAPEDLTRAALLLKEAQRPVDLSAATLREAAATEDFDRSIALRLTGALAEPDDHALRAILMPVFLAAIATCRRDADFHRDLTQDLLIDAARQHGLQLQLLQRIDARTEATQRAVADIGAQLGDIAAQSRDTLEALALRFGVAEPEDMPLADLRGFLIEKAKDYHRLLAQVQALQDREGRIANLKAAAEDAIRALRLDEAKQLIRDAIVVQRAERTLTALRDDAALVETEAEIALLEGDADEALRLLSGAAESFAPFDRLEGVRRRSGYLDTLCEHGLRYGGIALAGAIALGRVNLDALDETADADMWAMCQNDIGTALQRLGERVGGATGPELLAEAVMAYRAALRIHTEREHPRDWAMILNNLGTALNEQASRTGIAEGAALLAEAVSAYCAAFRVRTEREQPVDWAMTQSNLGAALAEQGRRTGGAEGTALLAGAVTAFREALRVRTEAEHPVEWAGTQNNLGAALMLQGSHTGGSGGAALLAQGVATYRAALRVHTEREHPVHWGLTQENLGLALEALAENEACADKRPPLMQAAECFEAALRVFDPEHMPYNFHKASASLARVRAKLSELS